MTKEQIQERVLKNGEPLELDRFTWDGDTKTFSSNEKELVLDFSGISYCTFKTGSDYVFKTGYNCKFKTGPNCIFETGSNCIFDTGPDCTFDTGSNCKFKTGSDCVVVRKDVFQVIELQNQVIQLLPYGIKGYLENGYINGNATLGRHIVVDGILSKIISKKAGVYKVINHNETQESCLIKKNGIYSHGATLKEAKESLVYKLANRNTSMYNKHTLETKLTKDEAIIMYMTITGACQHGTRNFVESHDLKDELTVQEVIDLTVGQYGHDKLVEYIND